MTCGIYCISNNINGMKYVGQSVDVETRFIQHIESDSNSEIHNAIVKYGVHNFRFELLLECLPAELDEQEVKFIRLLNTYEDGYNQTRGGQHHISNVELDCELYSELTKKLKRKNETIKNIKNNHKLQLSKKDEIIKNLQSKLSQQKLESKMIIDKLTHEITALRTDNSMLNDYFNEVNSKYNLNLVKPTNIFLKCKKQMEAKE